MAPNLTSGNFRIVSLEEGNPPAGVNFTLPGLQSVYLGAPVTKWVVRKDGPDTYRFQVGGYGFTGVGGDRVIASIHPEHGVEWIATYRKHQDAYTISPADNTHHGWTAPGPDDDSSREGDQARNRQAKPEVFIAEDLYYPEPGVRYHCLKVEIAHRLFPDHTSG
ncbi:hypothetical protein HD554DRAFT_2037680 [Boletus coccyginus]|nr:hypothetical protein HD554DRAFT_2037680 [Boletus coccyginus]